MTSHQDETDQAVSSHPMSIGETAANEDSGEENISEVLANAKSSDTREGFVRYRRSQIAELRPYVPGESMEGISVSAPDLHFGSPKLGDMIARNPKNHADQWLVAAQYFADNFEVIP